jgi:hypothetical protein
MEQMIKQIMSLAEYSESVGATVGFRSIRHHVTFYLSDKSPKTATIKKKLLPLSAKIACDA